MTTLAVPPSTEKRRLCQELAAAVQRVVALNGEVDQLRQERDDLTARLEGTRRVLSVACHRVRVLSRRLKVHTGHDPEPTSAKEMDEAAP